MTLPTWAERKGRASLVPLSKLQLLGVVRTAGGGRGGEAEGGSKWRSSRNRGGGGGGGESRSATGEEIN